MKKYFDRVQAALDERSLWILRFTYLLYLSILFIIIQNNQDSIFELINIL